MKKTKILIVILAAMLASTTFTACNLNSEDNDITNESSNVLTPEESEQSSDTSVPEESEQPSDTSVPEESEQPSDTSTPEESEQPSDTSTPEESESTSTFIPPQEGVDPEIYQYLEFYSYGDGTCMLVSIGEYKTEHLVIPAFSPNGEKVVTVGSSGAGCKLNYQTVTIPEGVETIRTAFRGCDALEVINIPKTVKYIDGSFQDSVNIKEVHITDMSAWMNIEISSDFGNPLFRSEAVLYLNGEPVIDLVVPDNVTSIGAYAFAGYDHLRSVSATTDSNLKHIGKKAFYNCPKLMRAVLSAKLSTIEEEAFHNCHRLVEVINPSNLDIVKGNTNGYIGYNAIKVETNLSTPSRLIFNDDFVFYNDEDNERILLIACFKDAEEIILPSDFNGEGYYINSYCLISKVAERLVVGAGVKGIRNYALANSSIKEIVFESGSQLRYIGNYSFSYCGIGSIHLPSETVVIGSGAFKNCKDLANVTFEENSKLKFIGANAFADCDNLAEIIIPKSVMCIGQSAFIGNKLSNVTFEDPTGWSQNGGMSFEPVSEQTLSSSSSIKSLFRIGNLLFKGTQEEYMEFIAQDDLKYN